MTSVVGRVGIALLLFLSGAAFLYLGFQLSSPGAAVDRWVAPLLEASSFGLDWWRVVLIGLGAALLLMSVPSPRRGDRASRALAVSNRAASSKAGRTGPLTEAPSVETTPAHPRAGSMDTSKDLPELALAPTPSSVFRSRPPPSRPRRHLIVAAPSDRGE